MVTIEVTQKDTIENLINEMWCILGEEIHTEDPFTLIISNANRNCRVYFTGRPVDTGVLFKYDKLEYSINALIKRENEKWVTDVKERIIDTFSFMVTYNILQNSVQHVSKRFETHYLGEKI